MPKFQWLEDVYSQKALDFAKAHSDRTLSRIQSLPYFKKVESDILSILTRKDRIPICSKLLGGFVYNFWQDDEHIRGIWRRASLESYCSEKPGWEILLDLDQYARSENKNYVWNGATYRKQNMRALVMLSIGGEDAKETHEFDLVKKEFVKGGFSIPKSKSTTSWYDDDTLFFSPAFKADELTDANYPKTVRLLKRGQPLDESKLLLTGENSDWGVFGATFSDEDDDLNIVCRGRGMNEYIPFALDGELQVHDLEVPFVSELCGLFKGRLIVILEADWVFRSTKYSAGSLLAVHIDRQAFKTTKIEILFEGKFGRAVVAAGASKEHLWVAILENVQTHVLRYGLANSDWTSTKVNLPSNGTATLNQIDFESNNAILGFESFTQPKCYYLDKVTELIKIKEMPQTFSSEGVNVQQLWATSKDGTRIPYFYVCKKSKEKSLPTIVYGYGGYNLSEVPYYLNETGKIWIEEGGAWVVANIRGGGEFGPEWHLSAIQENKQRSYDDFIAIAEDLIFRGLSTPAQLGIFGGSNGGLLVGAAFTQRPDLYNAVVCSVPLLDMMRYHKLPPGASWICEYGNPDEPKFAEIIAKYSPYQNVDAGKKYPEPLFTTSTKDDRVHPGHARKMVAKMSDMGHPVLYYENQEGGHSGSANLKQRAHLLALEFSYFRYKLMETT